MKPLSEIGGAAATSVKQSAQAVRQAVEELLQVPVLGRIVAGSPVPVPASDFSYYDADSMVDIARSLLPARSAAAATCSPWKCRATR